jgi:FkbM family methyltransferase
MRLGPIEVVRSNGSRSNMYGAISQLLKAGLRVESVIDVGVGYGTPEILKLFKGKSILLVEPNRTFLPYLDKIKARYGAKYVMVAASDVDSEQDFLLRDDPEASSFYQEAGISRYQKIKVPCRRIDSIIPEFSMKPPYLLKVDVQGGELKVLKGSTETLTLTEAVIVETGLLRSYVGAPELFDIVSFMKPLNFVVYDIFGLSYRPFDRALAHLDLVFVREDSNLRANKYWSR